MRNAPILTMIRWRVNDRIGKTKIEFRLRDGTNCLGSASGRMFGWKCGSRDKPKVRQMKAEESVAKINIRAEFGDEADDRQWEAETAGAQRQEKIERSDRCN